MDFQLVSDYSPQGDQPAAIESLVSGLDRGEMHQVLLGITGSGKTFTMTGTVNSPGIMVLILQDLFKAI